MDSWLIAECGAHRNMGIEELTSLYRQLTIRNKVLEASYAFSKAVSSEFQVEPLCDLVVEQLAEIFQAEDIALMFFEEESDELYVKRMVGAEGRRSVDYRFRRGEGLAGQALEQQQLVCVRRDDAQPDGTGILDPCSPARDIVAVPFEDFEGAADDGAASRCIAAAAPLMAERKVKGVVTVTWPAGSDRPSGEDLRMLELISAEIATAIDNAWLYSEITRLNENLEAKVVERTAELAKSNQQLSNALEELTQTQTQMVQQEKMASLGQLTAGIAHEINNPLAYAISNTALADERLETMELRFRLICGRLELDSNLTADDKLERGMAVVRHIEDHPDYKEDIKWFSAEARELPTPERVALLSEFLRYVEVSEEKKVPREELIQSFHKIMERSRDGLDRVKTIVLDLRSFSRLDEAHLQTVDLDDGIASTLTIVRHLVKDRQVTLNHTKGMSEPYVCFAAKLNQVVLNLVTNALQATDPGGTVTVSTRETENGPVIQVEDTGCGIDKENLTKVFDPFFTTKPVGQGTGLGLSISYKIVEEHGGQISVTSEPGEGTTFTLQLPPRSH